MMKPLGPLRQGTRTVNFNRRKQLFWPTTCTVTEVIPEQKLAFRVNANNTDLDLRARAAPTMAPGSWRRGTPRTA